MTVATSPERLAASGPGVPLTQTGAPRRWWRWLGLICGAALVLRVSYVLVALNPMRVAGDAYQYHFGANLLVDGKGFINAATYMFNNGARSPTAQHPPLYMLALAIPSALGLRSTLDHQLWSCLLGTLTVAAVGLAARRLAGPRTGLMGAGIAAVYPNLWIFDGLLASETLSLLTAAVTLLAAYRLCQRPSIMAGVGVGIACALAALSRGEAVLLLPLVAVPAALVARRVSLGRRLALAGLAILATAATLAPWIGFNLGRFDHPVLGTSTGLDLAMVGANCHTPYYGPGIGYWSFFCIPRPPVAGDETDDSQYYRKVVARYVRAHESRLPLVVAARIGRTWGLYQPLQQVDYDVYFESRNSPAAQAGLWMYYLLVVASVAGGLRLSRQRVPISPLVGTVVTVTIAVALVYGTTRFRVTAEPALVMLAAVGIEPRLGPALTRWSGRTRDLISEARRLEPVGTTAP